MHPPLDHLDQESLPPAMLVRSVHESSREPSSLPPAVLPPGDAAALLDEAGPLPSRILLLGRCVGPHTVTSVALSLASVAAREHYRSVADMALCHAYEAVVPILPDAGGISGQGTSPGNLSCFARQLLAAIGATEMFGGAIGRASRFSSVPSQLPGIHFPAPGRPRFLLAGAVDVIGIANAVLHCRVAGSELFGASPHQSLPCSPWAAAYSALAHSIDLAGPFWLRPCPRIPVDLSRDISPMLPVFERYPLSMEDTYGSAEFEDCADDSDGIHSSSPSDAASAGEAPMRLYVDCWDTSFVRVFRRHVSACDAMEMARQLALAAIAWDVPSASWVPEPVVLAAALAALGEDDPPALPLFPGCSSACPCHLGTSTSLSFAIHVDLEAARITEQRQEHRPWINHRHLDSPGGVDVVALANVIRAHDANLLEDRIQHLVTGAQRLSLPLWRGRAP